MQRKISSHYGGRCNRVNWQQIKQYVYNSLLNKLFPKVKSSIPIILAYSILTLIFTYPVLLSDSLIPGDGGDAYFYLWDIWWYKKALLSVSSPYWTPYLFHPIGFSLAFTAITPLNGIISVPLQLIFGTIRTYNLLWTCSFIIAGYGTYLLVKYLTNSSKAAFISGLIFMFSPYHFAHALGHLNLLSIEWIPFYILYLFKTLKESNLRNAIFAAILLLFVALSEYTYLLYLLFFTALAMMYCLFINRKSVINYATIKRLLALLITFGIMFSPFVYPLLKELITSQSKHMYNGGFVTFSADLMGYFIPSQLHPIFGDPINPLYRNFTGGVAEYTIFAGYIVLFLALIAIIKIKTKEVRFWILSLGVFVLLSLGPLLHLNGVVTGTIEGMTFAIPLPYALIMKIPIISIARAPVRWDVMVMLTLSILAGYGMTYIINKYHNRRIKMVSVNTIIVILISSLILFEFLVIPFPTGNADIPDIYSIMKEDTDHYAILEIPGFNHPEYMYYQTSHEKNLITGYGHIPKMNYEFIHNNVLISNLLMIHQDAQGNPVLQKDIADICNRESSISILNYYDIRYIVVHHDDLSAEQNAFILRLLEGNLGFDTIEFNDSSYTVYKTPADSVKPFVIISAGWSGIELWNEVPYRWMCNESTLLIHSDENRTVNLAFRALSFYRPRTLEVYTNGQLVQSTTVPTGFTSVLAPIQLHRGENIIRLHVPEGAERPCDIPELNNKDTRWLSVAVQNITLAET